MRGYQEKVILLFFIIALLSSCSTTRKRDSGRDGNVTVKSDMEMFERSVMDLNIGTDGFVIRKGYIDLDGTELDGRFGFLARVNSNGDFFLSLRGPLGIELARAISAGDSIFVINKVNRVIMVGKKSTLLKRSGLPDNIIELATGDLPDGVDMQNAKDSGAGQIQVLHSDNSFYYEIKLNRELRKISGVDLGTKERDPEYSVKFDNFIESDGKRYPSLIEIDGVKKMFHVKIEISDLRTGFNEKIDVVLPPYRRESL